MLDKITPVLLTYNEASNIGRTLSHLTWARDIVVVDSGSNDETLAIISKFPQVRVLQRSFDTHGQQWRYAVQQTKIGTSWILRLDADYQLSECLIAEMAHLDPNDSVSGYRIAFDYAVFSHKLSATLYPPNTILLRLGRFTVEDRGHTEVWTVKGMVEPLQSRIIHDDRKPLSRWFTSQQQYSRLEAKHLLNAEPTALSRSDRLRRMGWPAPILVFIFVLFVKGCIWDGRAGWYYALQRLLAECMIALELLDTRLRKDDAAS